MRKEIGRSFFSPFMNAPFALEPNTTALIIVDMQYGTACRTAGAGKAAAQAGRSQADTLEYRFNRVETVAVPNILKLLDFFRRTELRIIYLTTGSEMPDYSDCLLNRRKRYEAWNNISGSREHEILDEIKPRRTECVINKTTQSAFNSTQIDRILGKVMGVKYLLFTGVSTDGCVEHTARDAVDLGYRCVLVEDGLATTEQEFHDATLVHFRASFGRVATTDEIITELRTSTAESERPGSQART